MRLLDIPVRIQRLLEIFITLTIAISVPLGVQKYLSQFDLELQKNQVAHEVIAGEVYELREEFEREKISRIAENKRWAAQLTEVQVDVKWLVLHAQGKLE